MEAPKNHLKILSTEISQTSRLALPIVLGQVGQMTMGVVDTIVAGRVDTDALAGLGLGSIILWHTIMVFLGVLLALDTFFTQAVGARDNRSLSRWRMQSFWLALALSTLSMILLVGANLGYRELAPATDANEQFSIYLVNAQWSIPAIFGFFVFQRYWQARNRVIFLATITLLANGINLAANLALGLGWWGFPPLGTQGIAFATILSRWAMFFGAILYTLFLQTRDTWSWRGPDWSAQRALLKLGWPAGGQALAEIGVFVIASLICGFLGALPLASHHICLTMAAFTYMFANGFASAAAVRVGQAIGAENPAQAKFSGTTALWMAGITMAGFSTLYLAVPNQIAGLFTNDTEVIRLTSRLFLIVALFQIADGLQVTAAGALRGWGNTRAPMIANAIGHFLIGFPISLVAAFAFGLQVQGLWIGLACGLVSVAVFVVRIWNRARMPQRV